MVADSASLPTRYYCSAANVQYYLHKTSLWHMLWW